MMQKILPQCIVLFRETHHANNNIINGRRYVSIGTSMEDNSEPLSVKSFNAVTSVVPLSCRENHVTRAVIRTDKRITLSCFLQETKDG